MGTRRISLSLLSLSHSEIRRSSMPSAVIFTQQQLLKMVTCTRGDMAIKEDSGKATMSSREVILIVLFRRG
jgi:hypothetical protein